MADLPRMDVTARTPRLRERFQRAGCEALLVTGLVNVRYLTGFSGSAGLLLVLPDELVLVTDGRYRDQAAEQLADARVEGRVEVSPTAAGQRDLLSAAAASVNRLGLEAAWVTWAQQRSFAAEWFPDAELVPTEGLVEDLRRTKDEGEVARVAAAAHMADEALAKVLPMLAGRPTEADVALALEVEMRRQGASGPSFDTIVAAGPNGAKPHHRAGLRRIGPGEPVVIDFGARVDGYCSDMTRTVCVGEPADDVARRMREVVAESQQAGVDAVRPGATASAVDGTCRAVIAAAGWGDAFVHGTGHGVGLQIHEEPRVSSTSAATLTPGDVVTVEPGVYLPGHGGVRIEDTLVVTADGARRLTNAPKDFQI